MKKFNEVLFVLVSILLTTATTHAWEWPWNRQNATTENQTRSWTQFGKQYGKKILLGIKSHPKTALIGVGGLALAYQLWVNRPRRFRPNPQAKFDQIEQKVNRYKKLSETLKKGLLPLTQVQEMESLERDLFKTYFDYTNKNPDINTIEGSTLKMLQEWCYVYLEQKKQLRTQEEELELEKLEAIRNNDGARYYHIH